MAFSNEGTSNSMVMPVAPMYSNNYGFVEWNQWRY